MPTPPKRKPDSARRANRIIQQRTLLLLALLGIGTFLLLFAQLYKLQIKQHDELKTLAVRQQTLRTTVEASRGTIYDKNGDILALSSTAENVCVSPLDVAKNEQDQDLIANGLGEILGVDPSGILDDMKDTASQYKVIKKKVEQETADKVRVFISDNDIKGVFLEPTSKRYYPYSSLAAHVIGFVNANGGAYGLEAVYDEELTGEKGMVVSARDANGNALLYQYEQYFDAENGDSLVTTLDKTVQYYLEKGLEELESRYGTGVGATGIVMDVNTGGILAMASLPTYDLNAPASIYNKEMLAAGMTDEELAAAADTLQNMQWRNKAINDTFQPGSTFKILTLAMALEENKVKMSDTFNCPGYVVIEGAKINCSKRAPGHGHQDLITAFANSCNPAFINIGLRLGNTTFYNYMKAFGLTGKTDVDTTGEASGFVNKEIEYSTLALACYAFGQNFNVTPLSLINAQAACVNGGYLRTPYIVSEVLDQSGNVKYRHDTTPLRQVISENTSKTVREIMEYEVEHGTGKNGKVAGYRIGGKTGTADQIDGSVTVSFTCCAPADDPQIMMLLTLSNASDKTGTYRSGGNMAAPVASSIMAEILPYLGIEPTYSADELVGADHTVPNVVGLKRDEAATKLKEEGFSCRTVGDGETVTDQTPLGGAIVPNSAPKSREMNQAFTDIAENGILQIAVSATVKPSVTSAIAAAASPAASLWRRDTYTNTARSNTPPAIAARRAKWRVAVRIAVFSFTVTRSNVCKPSSAVLFSPEASAAAVSFSSTFFFSSAKSAFSSALKQYTIS